jgi:hypothetical protein
MAKVSKRRKTIDKVVDVTKRYGLDEAAQLVKKCATAKFDETVELAVRLGVNPKHADQMVRGALVLPHGTGQKVRVLVFAKGEKAKDAEGAGADVVGADELVQKVNDGFLDFDRVIATPDMMGQVGCSRSKGRQDRVPHREGWRRPGPHRQGLVLVRCDSRQRQGIDHRTRPREAGEREGSVSQVHHPLFDDGPGRANRPGGLRRKVG